MPLSCDAVMERLPELLDPIESDDPDAQQLIDMHEHVSQCASCQSEFDDLQDLRRIAQSAAALGLEQPLQVQSDPRSASEFLAPILAVVRQEVAHARAIKRLKSFMHHRRRAALENAVTIALQRVAPGYMHGLPRIWAEIDAKRKYPYGTVMGDIAGGGSYGSTSRAPINPLAEALVALAVELEPPFPADAETVSKRTQESRLLTPELVEALMTAIGELPPE